MKKVAVLIDGGHLRAVAREAGAKYDPDFIEKFAHKCVQDENDEALFRVLYYDCAGYRGKQKLPISKDLKEFEASDKWLDDLASRDLFAVRRGKLGWRGWTLKSIPKPGQIVFSDSDFKPQFEQKGVDMRIGLDIAILSTDRHVDKIVLVSADTDMIPAMKHARKSGLHVICVQLPSPPARPLAQEFLAHADFRREVALPI